LELDAEKLVTGFYHYLALEGKPITRAAAEQRMLEKLTRNLTEDIAPLLPPGVRFNDDGYTGFDLLNPEQRFQGATAIAISDEEAARLINEHFPKLKASELKYRALARRPGNQSRLLDLQREILGDPSR
jgi:hypothetical protein